MKTYDFVFSLGFSCGTSQALRAAGIQFASCPLDWVGVHDIGTAVRMVKDDFSHWFEREDLDLVDVWHGAGFMTRVYVNRRTQVVFCHEFSDFQPFGKQYETIRATYERRIERMFRTLRSVCRILVVWVEPPTHGRESDEILESALAALRRKFPSATVDLLVFFEEEGRHEPYVVRDEGGLTVVAVDYRIMCKTGIAHYVDYSRFVHYLRKNVTMPDPRTEEEKAVRSTIDRRVASLQWGAGKTWFRRRLNQYAYKMYRTLEKILQKRRLVHEEGPFWLWEDIRREAEGGAK